MVAPGGERSWEARVAQHVTELRGRAPAGFTIVAARPFVVVGDEAPEVVRRRAGETVGWAVARLEQDFFPVEPAEIIDIWLLRDGASYRRTCEALFAGAPHTPFGFYLPARHAMVMDISTGGGTLVHELVHPFLAANLPGAPPWIDEGVASLFEQCGERDGHIVGFTNWRLAGLQEAIRQGRTDTLERLAHLEPGAFNGPAGGRHYAAARYICYYLQEKGLLATFLRRFAAARDGDPSGYVTLSEVLGERDMVDFQRRWEAFVLSLRFPG